MNNRRFVSTVSIILILLTAAIPLLAASPPAGQRYSECTTPGGTLTTRADLVFAEQEPDNPPVIQNCTLTFIPNNGQENIIRLVPAGTITEPPEIGDWQGYKFDGWYTGGEPVDFTRPFSKDTVITAKWTPVNPDNPYEIAGDVSYIVEHYQQTLDGGYVLAESEYLTGKENASVSAAARSYTGLTENQSHPDRAASGKLNAGTALTLKLYYDRNIYKVVIDFGNGKPDKLEIKHGALVPKPDTPSQRGQTFNGWINKDTKEPVDWKSPLTGDLYIKATFRPKRSDGSSSAGKPSLKDLNSGSKDNKDGTSEDGDEILDKDARTHIAYIKGYPDGTVRPENAVTRGEVAQMIYRLMRSDYRDAHFSSANPYSDVDEKIWCNDAISTLTNAGLLKGYNDGTFGYDRNITRAEFTAMVNRFFAFSGSGECSFTDIGTHWAKADIERVASLGYIKGRTKTTFAPDAPISRAEAAAILNRILERGTESEYMLEDMKKWPDNPVGTWFYEDIQEAANGHRCEKRDEHEVWMELLQD